MTAIMTSTPTTIDIQSRISANKLKNAFDSGSEELIETMFQKAGKKNDIMSGVLEAFKANKVSIKSKKYGYEKDKAFGFTRMEKKERPCKKRNYNKLYIKRFTQREWNML
jgi:hypothetical protein